MKIIIEYDNYKLKNLTEKLNELFFNNNYDVLLLSDKQSQNNKNNILNDDNNYFLLSNKLNSDNNSIEIVYPLKDNDQLARELNNRLSTIVTVNKYYQKRSSTSTNLDYYELFRYLKNNNGIIIKYGENLLNNLKIPTIIYQVINDYLLNKNIYIVKSGDSLYSIAKKYNTSVDELKRINNLSSNLLSIGQKLIVPTPANNNEPNNKNTYIVKSGDSLYTIAKKYNTSVDELKKINNLSSNLLSINQKLIIPNNESINYTILKGDSLYSIAKKYNTTVDKIKKDNNLTSNLLSINQKLIIKK